MANCTTTSCTACGTGSSTGLRRLGFKLDRWDYIVGLAGNPNTGKSTVFNQLTGLRQHTGNWPGKTIARAEGGFSYDGKRFKLVDLPGTYSLLSTSQDEEVARDFILFGRPHVTIIVVDSTCLERNLNLVLQVLQTTDRALVCLNLMDEAKAHGIEIDSRGLARDLGVPVVPTVARRGQGMDRLLREVADIASEKTVCRPRRLKFDLPGLDEAIEKLSALLNRAFPKVPHAPWISLRLLEGDKRIIKAVSNGELSELASEYKDSLAVSTA